MLGLWKIKSPHENSDENKGSTLNYTSSHSHYIVENDLLLFFLCPKHLCVAEFKGDWLIQMAEDLKADSYSGCHVNKTHMRNI